MRWLILVVLLEGLSVQSGSIVDRKVYGEYQSVPACYLALDVIQRRIVGGLENTGPGGMALTCLPLEQ